MIDIRLCRHYIEVYHRDLLADFDTLEIKMKINGGKPLIISQKDLFDLNLTQNEWKVLEILLYAMGNQLSER
jgi:hypothetical protein